MDYRDIFALTAPPETPDYSAVFGLIQARKLAGLPFVPCTDPIEVFELADNPERVRPDDVIGVCLHEGRFYLGIFRRDGSGLVASMPGDQADGLAHFLHFELCAEDAEEAAYARARREGR